MNTTHTCTCGCSGSHACDCCTGPRVLTPLLIYNAPGQPALHRRAGDWDTFRRTMQARLSEAQHFPGLQNLATRETDDPSIAFLDAAAVVCDVLTFYNERFANEAYLRTASERRSLVELGKLIGYTPRPGVSASAWLAFTLDTGYNITIPAGTRAQSVPASSTETAQTFETSGDLAARAELNAMTARASVPQEISPANVLNIETVWLKGTGLNLKASDMLLFAFPDDEAANTPRKIHTVTEDAAGQRTTVKLEVEKLSAAYYVPSLRKNAQALRRALPDAWLTDSRPWAKNVAASLDKFTGGLNADSSLLDIENLFKPAEGSTSGLPEYLGAVEKVAGVARKFSTEIPARIGWKDKIAAALTQVLKRAENQETLLQAVFTKLKALDAPSASTLTARKAIAAQIVTLLDEGTTADPGVIQNCFDPPREKLRALRALAAQAAAATTLNAWDSVRLGPEVPAGNNAPAIHFAAAREAVNELGIEGDAEDALEAGMSVLRSALTKLTATGISEEIAGSLLDSDGELQEVMDDSDTPQEVVALFTPIRTELESAWTALEASMRVKLDVEDAVDATLIGAVTFNATRVDALIAAGNGTFATRTALLIALADDTSDQFHVESGQSAAAGQKDDLERMMAAGSLAASLRLERTRFEAESFSGLQRSIVLLTGRYKDALPEQPAIALEMRALEASANAATVGGGLSGLRTTLADSLQKVKDAATAKPGTVLDRLRAEMQILEGQVAVSPSGSTTAAPVSTSASGAALGHIVSGTTLARAEAPDDPLNLSRSLGAFVSSGTGGVASDAVSRLAGRLAGSTDDELFAAWRLLNTGKPAVEIYVMRVVTTVFGSGAPMRFGEKDGKDVIFDERFKHPDGDGDWTVDGVTGRNAGDLGSIIRLDGEQTKVVRDSFIVIERPRLVLTANQPLLQQQQQQPAADAAAAVANAMQQVAALFGQGVAHLALAGTPEAAGSYAAQSSSGSIFLRSPAATAPVIRVKDKDYQEALETRVHRVQDVLIAPHSAYSLSGKVTTVTLLQEEAWGQDESLKFEIIRRSRVYAASELLTLGEVPIDRVAGLKGTVEAGAIERSSANPFSESDSVLMLDGLYQGLEAGHRIMVAGERAGDISARPVREYALVSRVEHALIPALSKPGEPLPGDTPHTRLTLSAPLQYQYKRSTVTVYGNVAEATHGETKRETLGGGNARVVHQRFELRSVPVTHTAAGTATGAESTVTLRVDRVQWHAVTQFIESGPDDRVFKLEIGDDGKTFAVFGDGKQGARLPTGVENVTTQYRQGLGQGGNVRAESLSTLLDRPLGLKSVINLLAASGGADRDEVEDIRYNAPLPLLALDRLVSVSDYAAFSRAYAGIGKAEAVLLGGTGGAFVHVTIAGQDDAAIAEDSSLMTALTESLVTLGDPLLAVRVQSRELLVLMLAAGVRISADYAWADVEPALRAAVLAAFGFARRQPGQDVFLSEVIAVMQRVPGVDFVDVDAFDGVPEKKSDTTARRALTPEELGTEIGKLIAGPPQPRVTVALASYDENTHLRPAQLALLLTDLPETLILNQLVP